VVSKGEASKGEDHLSAPARVVGGRRVQHDGHEGPCVVNPSGLGMECGDGVGVESGGMRERGDLPPPPPGEAQWEGAACRGRGEDAGQWPAEWSRPAP
jgi:hypothetical protein